MTEKYERLPEWLRWILFLPLSVLFMFSAILCMAVMRVDFAVIHSTIAIVGLAIAVHILAPRWKSHLVLASLILRMGISIYMVSFIVLVAESFDWWELLVDSGREILGWGAGWSLYFSLSKEA